VDRKVSRTTAIIGGESEDEETEISQAHFGQLETGSYKWTLRRPASSLAKAMNYSVNRHGLDIESIIMSSLYARIDDAS